MERVGDLYVQRVRSRRGLEQLDPLARVLDRVELPPLEPVARGHRVERVLEELPVVGPARELEALHRGAGHRVRVLAHPGEPGVVQTQPGAGGDVVV